MTAALQPVFDGHNDMLLRLWRAGDREGRGFLDGSGGHIDLPRARAGGLTGGFFAVFVPNARAEALVNEPQDGQVIDEPPIPACDADHARRAVFEMAAILIRLSRARPDAIRLCTTVAEIETAEAAGAVAAIFHIEGAEAIGPDLGALEVLHAAGLRSLGPVWSRPNVFGHGVPFRFPASPDIGEGLTEAGRDLVRACNRLRILVDLSHLNAAGFWDVARLSDAPLVATHSNVHALSASSRNLTDDQLAAIRDSGGVVGLNYAVGFLREDGRKWADTPLSTMVRHLDHLLEKLGEDGVALGSDFDGALMPAGIGDAAGLPNLVAAMRHVGYPPALVAKICHDNWLSVLRRTWGS
jgi:membrane dipeptidase